jgi:hypothetical protein
MRRRCECSNTLNSREKLSNNTNGVLYRSKFCDITLAVIWVTHMFCMKRKPIRYEQPRRAEEVTEKESFSESRDPNARRTTMQRQLVMRLVLTLLAFIATLTGGLGLTAQPAVAQTQFPGYTTGIQIANLSSSSSATIVLTAYDESSGNQSGTPLNDTIQPSSSKTYFPISNVSSGFKGSIVVGSSQNAAGIVNILSSDFKAGASYVGRSQGDTTVLLPLLNKNNSGFTTWYSIQNAGNSDATVNVSYSDGTTAGPFTIKPGAARFVYQSQETHNQAIFAGTITSNQPVVAVVVQESNQIIFAYTAFRSTDASTNPFFPLVNANNAGYVTGIQIQNAGNQSTAVTLSYTPVPGNGTPCTETQTIAPGASATFALAAFHPTATPPGTSNCVKGAKFIGSARVTGNSANQKLVGIANQLLPGVNGEAYISFNDSDAGDTVVMPLIMDRNSGYFTGFNVQNVGNTPVSVNCTFQNSSYTVSANLAPGAALNDIQQNKIANGYIGSAICTGGSGAKLVAVVNELKQGPTDTFLVYEGVKQQ